MKKLYFTAGEQKSFRCPSCGKRESRTYVGKKNNRHIWRGSDGRFCYSIKCAACLQVRNLKNREAKVPPTAFSSARPYIKTKFGHLVMKYSDIRTRCTEVARRNAHIYEGLEFVDKKTFYEWALAHPRFNTLFAMYIQSGYRRKYAPSIDRIDTTKGYTLDNMQWLFNFENAAKGMRDRWQRHRDGERGLFGNNPNVPD